MRARWSIAAVMVLAASCSGTDKPKQDTAQPKPSSADRLLDSVTKVVFQDTMSDAARGMNVMTSLLDTIFFAGGVADSLSWTAEPDTCSLFVKWHVANRPYARGTLLSEWWGNGGFGEE